MRIFSTAFLLLGSMALAHGQKFWLTTNEFPNGPKTGITKPDNQSLFASYQHGVLRSLNEGNKFEESLQSTSIFTVFSTRSGNVVAGGHGKIFRSTNLGETWDSISLNTVYPITQFAENQQGGLFAITGDLSLDNGYVGDGVFFSDDSGKTWTQRNNGLGIYRSCERITVDKNGRAYLAIADELATGNGGLFISDNNGLQWNHVNIRVDGKNIIADEINVGNVTGLSVSPDDSLFVSFSGIAVNVLVQMNARKSIAEITSDRFWKPFNITNTNSWWYDHLMGNIHFAKNRDKYSSAAGSLTRGGTFFLKNGSAAWQRIDFGLGLDMEGKRSLQYFAEEPSGKIYMIQMLDERIYWTDTSLITSVPEETYAPKISVFPNPVEKGGEIMLGLENNFSGYEITLFDLNGNVVHKTVQSGLNFAIKSPLTSGIYLLVAKNNQEKIVSRMVVK
jgi:hypothetical protein